MADLKKEIQQKFGLIGESTAMNKVLDKAAQVAPTKINVLLRGESGVGKDVMARVIHGLSERHNERLQIVNCGAIPEGIIESELFGHERGSFTGAEDTRQGYFEMADGGTIFLDEIGDTPKNVQVKLLRILENGEYYRVGSSKVRKTDVRIIAATNRDLWKDVENGNFREDLYYRLDTVTINLPPLRERPDDVIPIFQSFVQEFHQKYDSVFQGFSDEARKLLISYRWPGNIRELRSVAEQLVVLEKSQYVTPEVLQKYLRGRQREGKADNLPVPSFYKRHDAEHDTEQERQVVYRALLELKSEISDMKKMLGTLVYTNIKQSDGTPVKALNLLGSGSVDIDDINLGKEISLGVSRSDKFDSQDADHEDIQDEPNDPIRLNESKPIPSMVEVEKYLIKKALDRFEGNRRKAADQLGMSERTLYRKLDQYDLI